MGYLLNACRTARKTINVALILGAILVQPMSVVAQSASVIVIGSNLGGRVDVRANQVIDIRSRKQRVKITGNICLSSCTMYLGAGDVCISPTTVFGFHGPSFYGAPLSEASFEYWSDVVASFYKEPLQRWYMQTARHSISKVHRISGAKLIKMGYAQCPV